LAQTPAPKIGIEEHLDRVLPLDELTFTGEDGQKVVLRDLFDLPVVLTLVYFRCPGICTPLLNEVARMVDLSDLEPGKDYRLVTISFEPAETPDLARHKRDNLLATMKHRKLSPDAWRFLTGDQQNIRRITEDVGFYYVRDKNQVDYVHAAAVTFVSPKGKISRYLTGVQFNPPDFKMAVLDASAGRSRSFMEKMQQLCYTYDPDSRSYVLQINRIILGVTVLMVITFALVLVFKSRRKQPPVDSVGGDAQ
jgi:protein SCO1/2